MYLLTQISISFLELFGNRQSQKKLPENVLIQIKLIEAFFDAKSKWEVDKYLKDTLLFQKIRFLNRCSHIY